MTAQRFPVAYLILLLGCVSFINVIHAKPSKNCTTLRNTFSNSHQNFVNCAITNSEPIKYCRHCGNGFSALAIHYNNLLANDECKALWFNRDRLNILELVYSSAQSLWTAGSCSSCYDWVDPSNNPQNQTESNTTKQFFDDLHTFNTCIKSNSSTVCASCISDYNTVNDLYKDIKETFNDNICFDIKDAMNKTRLNWSHNLNCCKDRNSSLTAFIVSSVVISGLIPFVFYTGFMFFGWRREQLLDPLLDSDVQPSASGESIETTIPAITHLLDLDA